MTCRTRNLHCNAVVISPVFCQIRAGKMTSF